MNYRDTFESAIPIEDYLPMLDEQYDLHQLNYKRATVHRLPERESPLKLLVLTMPKCSDSAAVIPVLQKLGEHYPLDIRVVLRDENPQLMEQFLTGTAQAIPIVIILDEEGEYLARFGPRPQPARQLFEAYREDLNQGKITKEEVNKKIRTFYARDRGRAILDEFIDIINQVSEKVM